MDTRELMRIVQEEDLEVPAIYGDGEPRAEGVVLERTDAGWEVYVADGRGGAASRTHHTFDNEPAALEQVLLKARQGTKYHRLLAARRQEQ